MKSPRALADTAPATCRAILLDFGGTLDADGVTWKERMRRLYAEAGLRVPAERFDPAFHAADDALVGQLPSTLGLEGTAAQLVRGLHDALDLAPAAGAEAIARRFAADSLERARRRAPMLQALGRRYGLAIVSNFYGNLEAVCEEAGIRRCFAAVVDSQVAGFSKPDPRIFRVALDALGVEPGQALFVGDSLPRDMIGARELGMPHVWVAPDASAPPCCPQDRMISSLDELEEILQ
jgi:HAD superfamily hydrolase (TIGR01509 family)